VEEVSTDIQKIFEQSAMPLVKRMTSVPRWSAIIDRAAVASPVEPKPVARSLLAQLFGSSEDQSSKQALSKIEEDITLIANAALSTFEEILELELDQLRVDNAIDLITQGATQISLEQVQTAIGNKIANRKAVKAKRAGESHSGSNAGLKCNCIDFSALQEVLYRTSN
jgi:hypothetical protein